MKQIHVITSLLLILSPVSSIAKKSSNKKSTQAKSDPVLTPTVYCTPTVGDEECESKKSIVDSRGKVLASVCPAEHKKCSLEGACFVKKADGSKTLLNAVDEGRDGYYFMTVDTNDCPYGLGKANNRNKKQADKIKQMCLDPYYTLAADYSQAPPGTVLYIEKLKGLVLPDGTKHTGLMIVRDKGEGIRGSGRFDFFTGDNCDLLNPEKNVFASINLNDKSKKVPYKVIRNKDQVANALAARNYPNFPPPKQVAEEKPVQVEVQKPVQSENYIIRGLREMRSFEAEGGK